MAVDYDLALQMVEEIVGAHDLDPRAVSPAIRNIYLIGNLEFEVALGGVVGWLTNSSGRCAVETASALEEVGAARCAAIVREMLVWFRDITLAEDDVVRTKQVLAVEPSAYEVWSRLAGELLQWPDDVDRLLRAYVQTHEAEFTR